MSVNKVIILGRIGQIEIKTNNNGDPIVNLSVATSEKWKDKQGEKQEKTEWHRIILFGHSAKFCRDYAQKGDQVYLEGKLQTRKWTDKQGIDKWTTEILVDSFSGEFQIISQKKEDAFDKEAKMIDEHNTKKGNEFAPEEINVSDIPF